MDKDLILEEISNKIISKINPNWNKIQKIRFVYLELGKYLEKNTNFFLNEKLGVEKKSHETLLNIYNNDLMPQRTTYDEQKQYQVICKSAALFLETTLKKIGIDVMKVRTLKEEDGIRHWFIAAKEDNDEYVFLTLAADLCYIKNNIPTKHFATNIPYIINGVQYYDTAEKINNRVISKEELEEIDKSIGYQRLYPKPDKSEVNIDLDPKAYQLLYMSSVVENTKIYDILKSSLKIDDKGLKKIDDINDADFLTLLDNLDEYVLKYIYDKMSMEYISTSCDINFYIQQIINKISTNKQIDINNNIDLKKQIKKIRKQIAKEDDDNRILNIISYLITINNNINNYVYLKDRYIEEYETAKKRILEIDTNEITSENVLEFKKILDNEKESKKRLDNLKKNVSMLEINQLLNRMAYDIILDGYDVKNQDYISSEYIANKLVIMFPQVFETGYNKKNEANSFSIQGYSEQIVIIKLLLKSIFSELTINNCKACYDYNINYSPSENRIQTFPLKDKETGEYCIGFNIVGGIDDADIYFIYIPSDNNFRIFDVLKEVSNYHIISDRFLNKINDLENGKNK